jgi:predicted DNA-binding protein (MmcQ/YjbR family)
VSPAEIDAFCRSLNGATREILWETDRVFKVGGKMFAVLGPSGTLSFKANDIAFEVLTETGAARPAPYMARAKWVFFDDPTDFDETDLKAYLKEAHAIIAERLTRKLRAQLGLI